MKLLNHIFGKKTPNSIAIAAEIEKARKEHDEALANRGAALAGLSMMDDATHQKAEAEYEAYRRAADRAAARIVDLEKAHSAAIAAEAEAAKIAAEAAHQKRIEAARNAVEVEGADLLREYARHAAAIADALARLAEIDKEAQACRVPGIDQTHRTTPGTQATERRERRKCWVYRFPGSPPDTGKVKFQYEAPREEVRPATVDADGKVTTPGGTEIHNYYGREIVITPTLEERDIVVSRSSARPPRYEHPLEDVQLPSAFAGGQWAWPRP